MKNLIKQVPICPDSSVAQLLLGVSSRLSHVFRYSSLPVNRPENVAEHSFYVSLYSLALAKQLEEIGVEVNKAKLLESAILHDLDEAMSGDFLRAVKYGIPGLKEALDDASNSFFLTICDSLGISSVNPKEFKSDDHEGHILAYVDLLCVVQYAVKELISGNRHMYSILDEVGEYLDERINKVLKSTNCCSEFRSYFKLLHHDTREFLQVARDYFAVPPKITERSY